MTLTKRTPLTDDLAARAVEAPEYQSLSGLAVLSLVLGLLSASALGSSLLLVIPAAAIGAGLLALGSIRASAGALTGAALARWGMALAVACVVAVLVRGSVRDALLQRQASGFAQQWLGLLAEERLDEARMLLSQQGASLVLPPQGPGVDPMPAEQAEAIAMTRLRTHPLTTLLAGEPVPAVGFHVDSVSSPSFDGSRAALQAELTLHDKHDQSHRHLKLQLSRVRAHEPSGQPWRIDHWELGEAHGAH